MRARSLINGSTYDPQALKLLTQAFEEAWTEIAHQFTEEPARETARLRLAQAVLAAARSPQPVIREVREVREAALEIMAKDGQPQPNRG